VKAFCLTFHLDLACLGRGKKLDSLLAEEKLLFEVV
jgi:hypothetical protein